MDALYFNTKNRDALFEELGIPLDAPTIFDSGRDWVIQWIGKLPLVTEMDEDGVEEVTEWQEGEFFNIYLKGQRNMDYFTTGVNQAVQILPEPKTPMITLF